MRDITKLPLDPRMGVWRCKSDGIAYAAEGLGTAALECAKQMGVRAEGSRLETTIVAYN